MPDACRCMLIRADELAIAPWKNGGGTTREIAIEPPDASLDTFMWRVSVADVEQAGPFSCFDGVERTLVLLSGGGMTLVDERDGSRQHLAAPLERVSFSGEVPIRAELPAGPTRDFNLMTRRGAVTSRLAQVGEGAELTMSCDTLLLVGVSGYSSVSVADAHGTARFELGPLDTLRVERAMHAARDGAVASLGVSGTGVLLCLGLTTGHGGSRGDAADPLRTS